MQKLLGFRPTLWPTLFSVPAILILCGLGVWQLERLAWKRGIIEAIETRAGAEPVELPPLASIRPEAEEYRRFRVTGELLHEKEIHLLSHTHRGNLGYQLIVPLRRADGSHVLVNRGWVPADRRDPASRPETRVAGTVSVTGHLRRGWVQGWFVPDNEPARNQWFFADLEAMTRQMGIDAPPFFIEAGPTPPGELPIGGQTRLKVPNNHLQYALTWFGFALILCVIYILYHRRPGTPPP